MNCLVVGAGDGLGLAIARRFGQEGFGVALVARRADALETRRTALSAEGIRAVAIAADMADPDAPARVARQAIDGLGAIDVLVYNCAAIGRPRSPLALDRITIMRAVEVNVLSPLALTQLLVPAMLERGGTLLFSSGTWAIKPAAPFAALGLTKAALRNLVFSLAADLGPRGIHAAIVTITGEIRAGTDYDAASIAEAYCRLHRQPRAEWQTELNY